MDESVIWGGLGVLVAIGGLGIILPETVEALGHGGVGEPVVLYGLSVAAAVALTVFIILPSLVTGR